MGRDRMERIKFHKSKEEHNRGIRILGQGTNLVNLSNDLGIASVILKSAFLPSSERRSARRRMRNGEGVFLRENHPQYCEIKTKAFQAHEQSLKEKIALHKNDTRSDRLVQLAQEYNLLVKGSGQFHVLIRLIAEKFYFTQPQADPCTQTPKGKPGIYFSKIS